jgi:enoyl-[acyl-carrier protein] reductase I
MLDGKRLLVTGVLTRHSIAFGIARRAQELGAEVVLTSPAPAMRLTKRAAARLREPVRILPLDVTVPDDYAALVRDLREVWDGLDGVVHSIAFAPPDAIGGNFLETRAESAGESFLVSAFSYKALAAALAPLLSVNDRASVVGLTFDGRQAWPAYDWMGVAKAALESVSRYVARDLGSAGIRSNLLSAGPLVTVAASAIPELRGLSEAWSARAPLGWDPDDGSPVADAACFLLSDMSRAISGEVIHVDGGFHAMSVGPDEAAAARAGSNNPTMMRSVS